MLVGLIARQATVDVDERELIAKATGDTLFPSVNLMVNENYNAHFDKVAATSLLKNVLTDSRSNKYSSKIEDTRHTHTKYILLQIKYNNIYCTKKEVHSHTQL